MPTRSLLLPSLFLFLACGGPEEVPGGDEDLTTSTSTTSTTATTTTTTTTTSTSSMTTVEETGTGSGSETGTTTTGDETGPVETTGQTCGNGILDPGEECDDGDGFDNNSCTNSCTIAFCGDGILRVNVEACDDGNEDLYDSCLGCSPAVCGDGFVWEGHEECDLVVDSPDCQACQLPRKVFVTSAEVRGDMFGDDPNLLSKEEVDGILSGIPLADAQCQTLAIAASLPGTFKAWISRSSGGPDTHFDDAGIFRGAYVSTCKVDPQPITQDGMEWNEGWEGIQGATSVPCTEGGDLVFVQTPKWTATTSSGEPKKGDNCQDWTTNDNSTKGWYGVDGQAWTDAGDFFLPCGATSPLYCFQDGPA